MKALLLALMLAAGSCAPQPATITTPQGHNAFTADQVVVRVNELMNAAISANAATPPALDTATTRTIVEFCVSADQTLAALPQGWQVTLQTGWAAAKAKIHTTNPLIVSLMAAVDAVLGATA